MFDISNHAVHNVTYLPVTTDPLQVTPVERASRIRYSQSKTQRFSCQFFTRYFLATFHSGFLPAANHKTAPTSRLQDHENEWLCAVVPPRSVRRSRSKSTRERNTRICPKGIAKTIKSGKTVLD